MFGEVETHTRLMTELSGQQLVVEDLKRGAVLIEQALPRTGRVRYETVSGMEESSRHDLLCEVEMYRGPAASALVAGAAPPRRAWPCGYDRGH